MTRRLLVFAAAVAIVAAACSSDDGDATGTATTTHATAPSTSVLTQTGAIWPESGTHFATPEAAAEDFVSKVLDVRPTLGEFERGDARSGEIVVFSPGEGGGSRVARSTLVLRQLGFDLSWFVLAAHSDSATITSPAVNATVPAGKVVVSGRARGFEANVVVRAYIVGDDVEVARAVTHGGSMADPEPYTASLDLSGVPSGSDVVIVVRGGTGLETDPGDFSAVHVVVR